MGGRGRLRVRIFCSEQAHFEKCQPPNLMRMLSRKTRTRSGPRPPIKQKQNILFQSRDIIVTMSKFVTKNRIYANFIVLDLRTFFSFEFVSRSSFTNCRHQISNNIYLEISL